MMLYVRNSRYALIHVHIKNAALVHRATFDIINTKMLLILSVVAQKRAA